MGCAEDGASVVTTVKQFAFFPHNSQIVFLKIKRLHIKSKFKIILVLLVFRLWDVDASSF